VQAEFVDGMANPSNHADHNPLGRKPLASLLLEVLDQSVSVAVNSF
jgi:hypothetical protein